MTRCSNPTELDSASTLHARIFGTGTLVCSLTMQRSKQNGYVMAENRVTLTILYRRSVRAHRQARRTGKAIWYSCDDLGSIVQQDHKGSIETAFLLLTTHNGGSLSARFDCNIE
jgi:hypothetical protein